MFLLSWLWRMFRTYYLPHTKKEWSRFILDIGMIILFLVMIYIAVGIWKEGYQSGWNMCINNFTKIHWMNGTKIV
jgi:hypothetical protein